MHRCTLPCPSPALFDPTPAPLRLRFPLTFLLLPGPLRIQGNMPSLAFRSGEGAGPSQIPRYGGSARDGESGPRLRGHDGAPPSGRPRHGPRLPAGGPVRTPRCAAWPIRPSRIRRRTSVSCAHGRQSTQRGSDWRDHMDRPHAPKGSTSTSPSPVTSRETVSPPLLATIGRSISVPVSEG